jgi:hypothetical protein
MFLHDYNPIQPPKKQNGLKFPIALHEIEILNSLDKIEDLASYEEPKLKQKKSISVDLNKKKKTNRNQLF